MLSMSGERPRRDTHQEGAPATVPAAAPGADAKTAQRSTMSSEVTAGTAPATDPATSAALERARSLLRDGKMVVLFDGVCGLCNRSVDFIRSRDPRGRVYFASLQSGLGQQLLREHGFSTENFRTIVALKGERALVESEAVLTIGEGLTTGLALAARALRLLPRPIRDALYRAVAARRLSWFGELAECRMPTAEDREKLLA